LKKCSRCGTDLLTGQFICPHCGKPQRRPRRVRCRTCGTVSSQELEVCPGCGEPLRHDWFRPIAIGALVVVALLLVGIVAVWAWRGLNRFQPSVAVSTVQAVASEVPGLIEVPTLTPSLTPSITPTPTDTPTPTPTPTLTPRPTATPTPTDTPTPTLTAMPTATSTRAAPTRTPTPATTPTDTPTPTPPVSPPALVKPEEGEVFNGEKAIIKLEWSSGYTLKPSEYYLVALRYTHLGNEAVSPVYVQETYWWVDLGFYLQADQETDRLYYWSVRIVHKGTDASGNEVITPLSSPSEERSFYWR